MSKIVEEFVKFQEKISTVTICKIDYKESLGSVWTPTA